MLGTWFRLNSAACREDRARAVLGNLHPLRPGQLDNNAAFVEAPASFFTSTYGIIFGAAGSRKRTFFPSADGTIVGAANSRKRLTPGCTGVDMPLAAEVTVAALNNISTTVSVPIWLCGMALPPGEDNGITIAGCGGVYYFPDRVADLEFAFASAVQCDPDAADLPACLSASAGMLACGCCCCGGDDAPFAVDLLFLSCSCAADYSRLHSVAAAVACPAPQACSSSAAAVSPACKRSAVGALLACTLSAAAALPELRIYHQASFPSAYGPTAAQDARNCRDRENEQSPDAAR
jgi:hypothetical protein